jgi:endonuclease G
MRTRSAAILVVALLVAAGAFALWPRLPGGDDSCPAQFAEGRPPATEPARDRAARTLCFSGFAVRHSGATRTPLWSAEKLTGERLRRAAGLPRTGKFHEERRLPQSGRSGLSDYRRTGYDRGHMAPSGDMPDPEAQNESFTLANMVPQHPCSNQVTWYGLEQSVREIALRQDELYVVTGPIYSRPSRERRIGGGVMVPDELFKAVYDPVTGQAGAYVAENAERADWRVVSMAQLKEMTGIDVFPALPDDAKAEAMKLPPPARSPHKCNLHSSGETPQ